MSSMLMFRCLSNWNKQPLHFQEYRYFSFILGQQMLEYTKSQMFFKKKKIVFISEKKITYNIYTC